MAKKIVTDLAVAGKKVLVRADFNVPMKDGNITNDDRIVQALPTIKHLLKEDAKVVVFSHLGRVKEEADKEGKSLKPVAERLSELLGQDVTFVPETRGEGLENAIDKLGNGDILMFENTRFEDIDGKKESKNDPELGKYWASLGDLFVNDAFGTAHRAHASNVGIASNVESAAGFLMEKEIRFIGDSVDSPERPFVAILGGAKVSDKIGVIENLLTKADKILIGGGMAYTFYKAQGMAIGSSLLEEDKLDLAKDLLARADGKIILPVDTMVNTDFSEEGDVKAVDAGAIPDGYMGLDIGPKSVAQFENELDGAKTVVWNGPMGVFEMEAFAQGTIGVCKAIASLDNATTIIGGGDSAAAAMKLGFADDFSHISTGGGASLEYLEGKELPGLAAISNK
ncbi:phosphoglycerate kinase [Halolactibacillus halophilus]|uniref:Phosphoglycerate kinase n=1 Tax=Halolactibacillus halophilus TaxID=306540 RepID=A0A1I5MTQ2_9BACI|nr:phosphoglycerate kinase [Halolactibacillus halophilus]GEM01246.1 phosphoglycerate kinase [Halolactibacillus halophilus]SFP12366.1 phosphoglycerate kinase [Halolactibacillus halophilus]